MFYTLLKFLGWGVLLAVIGACIGWALRALKCRGELARARQATVDADEVDEMRHQLATLEQVVAERDRLRMQIADMRHTDSPGVVGVAPTPEPEPEPDASTPDVDLELDLELDLDAATAALGKRIVLDDLTTIEGIGPKIAELCSGLGISTWRGLADTEIADLRSMLAAAGSRYQMHDPTTWPEQAACLAEGRWADFVSLTEGLAGRR